MINLLVLLRFEILSAAPEAAEAARREYLRRVRDNGGRVVDHDGDQLLVCLTDMRWGLQSLRTLLAQARREGFAVRAAIVQAVLARADASPEGPGFTTRTLDTLLRLAGHVGRQQVGITPKLLSLIQLSAPEFADLFTPVDDSLPSGTGALPSQPILVMAG